MQNFRAKVLCPRTFLFTMLVALPVCARASDASFDGGSGCTDPPIFSNIFTLPPTSTGGGLCRAFGNHSGSTFTSLRFTGGFPTTISDPFLCSPGPFFLSCDFVVDGTTILHSGGRATTFGSTVTIEFFGTNADHAGIPNDTSTDPTSPNYYNFFINLNNPTNCNAVTGICTQPYIAAGTGDWQPNQSFAGAANGATVPEPGTLALLLTAIGALIGRDRWRKKACPR